MLIEYGLLDEAQCDEIKQALYLKIPVYRSLETIIDRDSSTISEYWVNIWYEGLKSIREYYCEILINYLYMKKDNEVLALMQKLLVQKENNEQITLNFLKNNISFNNSIVFEESFSKKMMEFIDGYLVSQNTINKKYITSSMKIDGIIDNFLQNFSNVEDPYLKSLRILRDQDFENYLAEMKMNPYNRIDLSSIAKELLKIRARIIQGSYTYKESQMFKDLEQILDNLNDKIHFIEAIQENSKNIYHEQKALFNADIPMTIELIISCFSNELKNSEFHSLIEKFCLLIEFFHKDNLEHHSIHLVENNFWNYENLLYVFPAEISKCLLNIAKDNAQVVYVKEYILDVILCIFGKQLKSDEKNKSCYQSLINVIDILILHHQEQYEKVFDWIPEYDVRITMDLVSYNELFAADEIEKLLTTYKDSDSLEDMRLNFLMNLLKLLQKSTSYRFVETSYKKINETYNIDRLTKLIKLAGNNIEFRKIFYELYTNIHIDFKDHLVNNRADYYCTKPADMQYEEDPFYDKEYNKTLDLISEEIKWIMENFSNQTDLFQSNSQQYLDYFSETVMVSLIRLINYFSIIKEGDLHKLNKYINKLEEVSNFLFDNKMKLCAIYGSYLEDLDSPERKKLEVQLAKIDENQKIKKEKVLIVSHCNFILETCSFITSQKPILGYKRKLMNYKSAIERSKYSLQRVRHFSKDISERKENFSLIYDKFQRRIQKNVENPSIISRYLAMSYEQYKLFKMSVDAKKNYYIRALGVNQETKSFALNICHYIHNVLKSEWNIDKKISKLHLIECLCQMLYINPVPIQDSLYKLISESTEKDCPFLDKIWSEMKWTMSYVKFKTNIDKYWKEGFRKVLIIMKFHLFLCKGQTKQFKDIFREKILPSDSIDRVQRWTTVFQRMSDNCEWHYNYMKGEITNFGKPNRPYLIPLSIEVFENLSEVCSGNNDNKNKVYTYIYDRYNGILKRFVKDPSNSEFYNLKLALIKFILVMAEGMNQDILNYQVTNFELTNINTIIINSVKQLYFTVVKNDKMQTSKKLSEYLLKLADYEHLAKAFDSNPEFSNHSLLRICKTLFLYILRLKENRLKYENFCKEREDMIINYNKTKELSNKYITEEDFVSFMFLNEVVCKGYYEGKKIKILKGRSISEEKGKTEEKEYKEFKEKNKGFVAKLKELDLGVKNIQSEMNKKSKGVETDITNGFQALETKVNAHKTESKEDIKKLNDEIQILKTNIAELKSIILTLNEKLGNNNAEEIKNQE